MEEMNNVCLVKKTKVDQMIKKILEEYTVVKNFVDNEDLSLCTESLKEAHIATCYRAIGELSVVLYFDLFSVAELRQLELDLRYYLFKLNWS